MSSTAVVTFLFSDIEGSTRLLRKLGERYDDVLADHRRLLRGVIASHRGDEVRGNEGDGFFIAFDDAADAVAAAVEGQRVLQAHPWPPGVEVRVRMGIHTGPVKVVTTGPSGITIHEAERVRSAAVGGQILVSPATEAAVAGRLPDGVALVDTGAHDLKDFDEPVHLFEVDFDPDVAVEIDVQPPLRRPASSGPATRRVVLVDDQEMVRAGFRMILESRPGIEIVGEASNGRDAVEVCRDLRPDVVLMDIRMPELDGIEATKQVIEANGAGTKVLILTTFDLDEYVYEAVRAGASGFLLKDAPAADLVHAIDVVARGDALLAPTITRRLVEEFAQRAPAGAAVGSPAVDDLTEREKEVLLRIARGLSNAEIGTELFLGETTIKSHVSSLLAKLGLRDRVQAVVFAYESGLVRPGS